MRGVRRRGAARRRPVRRGAAGAVLVKHRRGLRGVRPPPRLRHLAGRQPLQHPGGQAQERRAKGVCQLEVAQSTLPL